MTPFEGLVIAFCVVFVINIMPYFMPATWTVVTFFVIVLHLPAVIIAFTKIDWPRVLHIPMPPRVKAAAA